jgi:hypothetical protein
MKRVFISTDFDRILNLFAEEKDKEDKAEKMFIIINSKEKNLPAFYNVEKNCFLKQNNSSQIILLRDTLVKLENINIDDNNDYLLYHSITKSAIRGLFKKSKLGHHEPEEECHYKPVFDIILDEEGNKFNRIMNFLFPPEKDLLETKLVILHKCLAFEEISNINWEVDGTIILTDKKTGESKILPEKITDNVVKDKFEILKGLKTSGPFGDEYINALTELRDCLLKDNLKLTNSEII